MKIYKVLLSVAIVGGIASGAVACERKSNDQSNTTRTTGANAPDNTGVNERDRDKVAVTPMDQKNSRADLDTTQAIRKAVMADDSLSMTAKNVKVITDNGVITLRGPVKTEAEKKTIEAKARSVAGNNRVDNQIDVESAK